MFSRFDVWLGRTMFYPPIIWICQFTRQSQYTFSKLIWFGAALYALYKSDSILQSIFFGFVAIASMVRVALIEDSVEKSHLWFRILLLGCLVLDIVMCQFSLNKYHAINLGILFAEYALTIKTLPPKRKTSRKISEKVSRV